VSGQQGVLLPRPCTPGDLERLKNATQVRRPLRAGGPTLSSRLSALAIIIARRVQPPNPTIDSASPLTDFTPLISSLLLTFLVQNSTDRLASHHPEQNHTSTDTAYSIKSKNNASQLPTKSPSPPGHQGTARSSFISSGTLEYLGYIVYKGTDNSIFQSVTPPVPHSQSHHTFPQLRLYRSP
jgi:hypothetical protein